MLSGAQMGKQPITWLCSPWWTSTCASVEGEITNENAMGKKNNLATSSCHLLPNNFLLQVKCNVYVPFLVRSFNLWEPGVPSFKQLVYQLLRVFCLWKIMVGSFNNGLIFSKEHQSNTDYFMDELCLVSCMNHDIWPLLLSPAHLNVSY